MAGSNDVTGGPDPEERTPSEMLPINFLRFNQDVTSLALSTAAGYKLYSLTSVEVLDCVHQANVPREDQVKRGREGGGETDAASFLQWPALNRCSRRCSSWSGSFRRPLWPWSSVLHPESSGYVDTVS